MTYIHYGQPFDREKFEPIRNRNFSYKPYGGLWASPTDAGLGWKQWCALECPELFRGEHSFTFHLSDKARVLDVYKRSDVEDLPRCDQGPFYVLPEDIFLDFEELKKDYDAIELHLTRGDKDVYRALYTWDCDSILIMNPDIIVMEQEVEKCIA